VDDANTVSIRTVKLGDRIGTMWIVARRTKGGRARGGRGVEKARSGAASQPKPFLRETEMSKFFISRPIVAMVISILTVIVEPSRSQPYR